MSDLQSHAAALADGVAALHGNNQGESAAVDACCSVADEAFRRGAHELAFAVIRASLHKHGLENDKLCRRYFFLLDTVVKARMSAIWKPEGPPKMLYLREMLGRVPEVLSGQLALLGGVDGVKAGERCVLMKERGVMVIGLSLLEWRLLLEKQAGPKMEMQMISGVEEAVVRGLSQSEGMSDLQAEIKLSWNAWALKLCEAEEGTPQLRGKCLLQRTVLLLAQNSFQKAIDSSGEVMRIQPANKHAAALNATALHKIGRKKEAASAVTELIGAFQRSENQHVQDELGAPLELVVSLLVEMHRTKEALRLLSQLLSRVSGPRHRPFFFGLARLYAKHGLNKDALVLKLPQLCTRPPDRRTWDALRTTAPDAVPPCAIRDAPPARGSWHGAQRPSLITCRLLPTAFQPLAAT